VIEPAAFEPHPDPIEQWLRWEEQANLLGFRTSTEPVELAVAEVPRSRVGVETGARTPAPIAARFLLGDRVRYPKHPLNRDASVAFHDEPEQGRWLARYTSSRTLVVVDGEAGARFSIKASTDHPHPDFVQPEKTRLREEAEDAMRFARRIDAVDARLGADPALLLVKEVMTVLAVGSEHGFVVRDLAPLHDGSHYLPGLSVPFAGPAIARRLGAAFAELWGRFYAESVGRAKAKLLARYGLQYDTPNPQNLLVQLGRDLLPTGAIVFRDMGDLQPVVEANGTPDWSRALREIRPETRNSFWAFDCAGEHAIAPDVLDRWCERHDRAYMNELARFWDLPAGSLPSLAPDSLAELARYLSTPEGRRLTDDAFDRRAA
jgi:hypothetical protein